MHLRKPWYKRFRTRLSSALKWEKARKCTNYQSTISISFKTDKSTFYSRFFFAFEATRIILYLIWKRNYKFSLQKFNSDFIYFQSWSLSKRMKAQGNALNLRALLFLRSLIDSWLDIIFDWPIIAGKRCLHCYVTKQSKRVHKMFYA